MTKRDLYPATQVFIFTWTKLVLRNIVITYIHIQHFDLTAIPTPYLSKNMDVLAATFI